MATITLKHGDVVEQLKTIEDGSIDAIAVDPPYNLNFMGKGWDSKGSPQAFQKWCTEWGVECLRVLRKGGFILSFGGTRTFHRLASGLEDAGFVIKDCFSWNYGSGFPAGNRDMGKAVGPDWTGYGTRLKPAWEPIILAQKPFKGTTVNNVITHGVGVLNIEVCRIPTEDNLNGGAYAEKGGRSVSQSLHQGGGMNQPGKTTGLDFVQPSGRFPANVIFDEEAGQILDSQQEGISRFFYCPKTKKRERTCEGHVENKHPTVKPLKLMEHLVALVCPSAETMGRTPLILDCFVGSGSTAIAAHRLGINCIGIDLDEESLKTTRLRLMNDWRLKRGFGPLLRGFIPKRTIHEEE